MRNQSEAVIWLCAGIVPCLLMEDVPLIIVSVDMFSCFISYCLRVGTDQEMVHGGNTQFLS